jgi:hypothetical protein
MQTIFGGQIDILTFFDFCLFVFNRVRKIEILYTSFFRGYKLN